MSISALKKAIALLIVLILSSASMADEPPHLYTNLVKGPDNGYSITEISTKENRVDLTEMKPIGFDQSRWDCSKMLFGSFTFSDYRPCVPPGSEFRTSRKRIVPTAILGAATFGASVLFGVIIEESVFDEKAFQRALNEALASEGLDKKREQLIKRFVSLNKAYYSQNEELAELFKRYRDEYYRSPGVKLNKEIVDESGLYANDLYLDLLIRVNKNPLTDLQPPRKKPIEFSSSPVEIDQRLEEMESSFTDRKSAYEEKLQAATREYTVYCGPVRFDPYHIRYECPRSISLDQAGAELSAKAIVVSKDLKGVFPGPFSAEDSNIKVTFNKGKLTFENRTSRQVRITGVSMVYNGKAATVEKTIVLEPLAKLDTTGLYSLVSQDIQKAAEWKELTLEAAGKLTVSFALGVSYSTPEAGARVASAASTFKLSELVAEQSPVINISPIVLP